MSGPTPAEKALAAATITVGGVTVPLTDLSHSVPIVPMPAFGDAQREPAVRVFRKDRGPWLDEPTDDADEAREWSRTFTTLIAAANGTRALVTCSECGEDDEVSCFQAKTRQLVARSLCFNCDYWHGIIASVRADDGKRSLPRVAVVGGRFYVVKPMSTARADLRGFGGMHKRIRWHDGLEAESNDLWNGSDIPERFRDRLADTAEFLTLVPAPAGSTREERG